MKAVIKYCYPTSAMAERFGKSGYYAQIGGSTFSPVFVTLYGAERWCMDNEIVWEPHRFIS